MLDHFCIFTKSGASTAAAASLCSQRMLSSRLSQYAGVLLWTWSVTALRGSPVNALVQHCLLEERTGESSYTYNPPSGAAYTLKWTLHNVRTAASAARSGG